MNKALYIIGGLALLFLGFITFAGPDALQELQKPTVKNSIWDDSVWQVEEYLEENLKDPDSYESIEWGPVLDLPNSYIVHHKYRAKNGFGGYVVAHRSFKLDKSGEIIEVRDLKSLSN